MNKEEKENLERAEKNWKSIYERELMFLEELNKNGVFILLNSVRL